MLTQKQIIDALRNTLDMRDAAAALIAEADAKEAALDAMMTTHGYDAAELMHRAYCT